MRPARQSATLPAATDGRDHRPHERGHSAATCDRVDDSRSQRAPPIDHNATGPDSPILHTGSPYATRGRVDPPTAAVIGSDPHLQRVQRHRQCVSDHTLSPSRWVGRSRSSCPFRKIRTPAPPATIEGKRRIAVRRPPAAPGPAAGHRIRRSPGCGNCRESATMVTGWQCDSKTCNRAAPSGASIPTGRSPWSACSDSARKRWS